MKKVLFILLSGLALSACSHQKIDLRTNHFTTPTVADKAWSGHLELVATPQTRVTLTQDASTNPPKRDNVKINEDLAPVDALFPFKNLSLDAGISVSKGLELTLNGSVLGLKYQFLNHGHENKWVASAFLGAGSHSQDTNNSTDPNNTNGVITTEADIKTMRAALSFGYRHRYLTPYFSLLGEKHEVDSKIKNSHGTFDSLKDKGQHYSASLGISNSRKGLSFAAEYSLLMIDWERAEEKPLQSALGIRLGLAW